MATSTAKTTTGKRVLQGKTAIVTGAGRGVGKAIAVALAEAGACTIFVVRDRERGEEIIRPLAEKGLKVDIGIADLSDPARISMLKLDLAQRYPTTDILVNNAGVLLDEDRAMHPANMDPLILDQTLIVNLHGPIRMCAAFVPSMPKGGRIINVSSTMGQLTGGSDGYAPSYCISKAALNMFTQLLAADLRDKHIMVDSFHPGWVKTDMGGPNAKVDPSEAAQTALFLASRPQSTETGLFWHDCKVIDW